MKHAKTKIACARTRAHTRAPLITMCVNVCVCERERERETETETETERQRDRERERETTKNTFPLAAR